MPIKNIVGIDPGVSGALAVLKLDRKHEIIDMPTIIIKKTKREIAPVVLGTWFSSNFDPKETHVFIEKVHTMPGQGIASSGAFMYGFGMIVGVVAALKFPYTLVSPQRWKKVMLADLEKSKGMSRQRAMILFPSMAEYFKRVKDDGRAEAMLIADYGRRVLFVDNKDKKRVK